MSFALQGNSTSCSQLLTRQSSDKGRTRIEDSDDEYCQLTFPVGRLMSPPFPTPKFTDLYTSPLRGSSVEQLSASRQALQERFTYGHSSYRSESSARLSPSNASLSSFTGSRLVLKDLPRVKKSKLVTCTQALREHYQYGRSSCSSSGDDSPICFNSLQARSSSSPSVRNVVLAKDCTPFPLGRKTKLITHSQALKEHFRYGRSSCSSTISWSSVGHQVA